MRLLNNFPSEQESNFLRSTMIDIARALLISGMRRIPIKVFAMFRMGNSGQACEYALRVWDLTPIDGAVVQGSPEQGGMHLIRTLLEQPDHVLMCGYMASQHGEEGHELVVKLVNRRELTRIELKVDTANGKCTLVDSNSQISH